MLRIGCYSRKSVYSDKSDSTEVQFKMASDYCNSHYTDFELYRYEDEGYTGANTSRPDYNRLICDVKDGRLDIVICYKIDRISRNVLDFSEFFSLLSEYNVEFVCIKDQIDTSTPLGRAMMYICSVFSQMERETIAERVADNMIELAKSGKWTGGSAPTGYTLQKTIINGKNHTILSIDESGSSYINHIADTFINGKFSLTGLETYFKHHNFRTLTGNFFSSTQIYNILKNPIYAPADKNTLEYFKSLGCIIGCDENKFDGEYGIMVYGRTSGGKRKKHTVNPPNKWIISVGLHKPIMSSDKWLSIQQRFGQNVLSKTRKHKIGLLKGALRCSCGYTMRPKRKVDKEYDVIYEHYFCPNRERRGVMYCSMPAVRVSVIDNTIIELLKNIALDRNAINNYVHQELPVHASLRTRSDVEHDIDKIELQISNLTSTLSSNANSAAAKYIISEIEKMDKKIAGLKYELLEIESFDKKQREFVKSNDDKYEIVCDIVKNLDSADYDELNELITSLLKECVWDGKSLKVKL